MRIAVIPRNEMLDVFRANFNAGKLRVYSGVRPTDSNTALSGNTLLVEMTYNATAFTTPSGGSMTANAIAGSATVGNGTATFARSFKPDGVTPIADHSVSLTGGSGEVQLSTLTVFLGLPVTAGTITVPFPVGP